MRKYIYSTFLSLMVLGSSAVYAADGDSAAAAKKDDAAAASTSAAPAEKAGDKADEKPADKAAEKPKKEPKAKKEKTPKTATAKSGGGGGGAGGIASHVASFVAGTFVGIPVQMVRKSKVETIQATRDLVGDTDKKWLTGMAAVLGVPAGILSGCMQSFVYGPLDAYRGTKDEPFSPEAFSLGDSK